MDILEVGGGEERVECCLQNSNKKCLYTTHSQDVTILRRMDEVFNGITTSIQVKFSDLRICRVKTHFLNLEMHNHHYKLAFLHTKTQAGLCADGTQS